MGNWNKILKVHKINMKQKAIGSDWSNWKENILLILLAGKTLMFELICFYNFFGMKLLEAHFKDIVVFIFPLFS